MRKRRLSEGCTNLDIDTTLIIGRRRDTRLSIQHAFQY
ncbi:hypothetical protein EMIT0158MI4_90122 [Burkholderia ambifaria]